jgi:MoxR-like ATPase
MNKQNSEAAATEIAEFQRAVERLRDEVSKVVVGQEEIVDQVIIALLAGGHVLLEGVPGLGKTLLVRTLSTALDLESSRIQFTPDLQPKDIIGGIQILSDESGQERRVFERGPIFANIVLADEINRATPRTQSALLEAMAEQSVTVGTTSHQLEAPFFVLATQNPLEMDGTYPLPEAQLDRFIFKLHVEYPSLDELDEIMNRTVAESSPTADAVLDGEAVVELRRIATRAAIAPGIQRYALKLLRHTHPDIEGAPERVQQYVREGASPRGGQAILRAARIRALMDGRPAVSTEDVEAAVLPALRHRLILNFEGEAEGIDRDELLREVIAETPNP